MEDYVNIKTGIYGVVGLVLVVSMFMLVTSGSLLGGFLDDPRQIDSCTIIDQPGRYELTRDVTNSSENTCIEITASNVILDGQEHTIDGNADESGVGVFVHRPLGTAESHSNVTVQNLTLTEWYTGIMYMESDNGRITDTNVTGNTAEGIKLMSTHKIMISNNIVSMNYSVPFYPTGINVIYSSETTFSNNTVTGNSDGIRVAASFDSTLSNNTITGNGNIGVLLSKGTNDTLSNNTVTDNDVGIKVNTADTVTLSNNTVTKCTVVGIWVDDSETVTLSTNNVTECEGGLSVDESDTVMLSTNNVTKSSHVGIDVRETETARISNNTVTESRVGINIDNASDITVTDTSSLETTRRG